MNKPNSNIWGKDDFKAIHLGAGVFSISTARHGGIAIAKASLNTVECLKPLNNLDLTPYTVSDDEDYLYFEEHQNVQIVLSLLPVGVFQKFTKVGTYEKAAAMFIQSQHSFKNFMPSIYEKLHGEELNALNCTAIAEAEYYCEHHDKYVINARHAAGDSDLVVVTTQKLSDGEIYGPNSTPMQTYKIPMDDYQHRVKSKIIVTTYPSNKQNKYLLNEAVLSGISEFKQAS